MIHAACVKTGDNNHKTLCLQLHLFMKNDLDQTMCSLNGTVTQIYPWIFRGFLKMCKEKGAD